MAIKTQNPWGVAQGYDQQRSDLWVVDLREATLVSSVRSGKLIDILKEFFPNQMGTLNVEELPYTAYSVSLPAQSVTTETFYRSSTPYPMPGMDAQTESMRIVFRHTSGLTSPTYMVLELWKELARMGRLGHGNDGVLLPYPGYTAPFRFDLPIRLYAGAITGNTSPEQVAGGLSLNSDTFTDSGNTGLVFGESSGAVTLTPSATYIAKRCWVQSLQLTEMSHETGNQLLGIQAQLAVQYIFDGKNTLNGNSV